MNLINKVIKEDSLLKFVLLIEEVLGEGASPEERARMFREPEENISAGIDILKYIAKGEGGDFSEEDLRYALSVYRYLFKLLNKAKPELEDELAAIQIANKHMNR